jgi:hypothetical protein
MCENLSGAILSILLNPLNRAEQFSRLTKSFFFFRKTEPDQALLLYWIMIKGGQGDRRHSGLNCQSVGKLHIIQITQF